MSYDITTLYTRATSKAPPSLLIPISEFIRFKGISISYTGQYQVACSQAYDPAINLFIPYKLYYSHDYGVTWDSPNLVQFAAWTGIHMADNGFHVTAIPESGQIHRSTDGGITWAAVGPTQPWVSIYVSSSGQNQIAGARNGNIYISRDFGGTWAAAALSLPPPPFPIWSGVAINDSGNCIAGGSDIYFLISSNYGVTWSTKFYTTVSSPIKSVDMATHIPNRQTIAYDAGILITNDAWQTYRDISFTSCKSVSISSFSGEFQVLVTGTGANEVRITDDYWQTNRIIYTMRTTGQQPLNGKNITFAAISGNKEYIMIAEYPNNALPFENIEPYQLRSAYMKQRPNIIEWPTVAGNFACDQPLQIATLVGGNTTTPGKFLFAEPMRIPPNGTSQQEIIFVSDDSTTYNTVSQPITVTVDCSPSDIRRPCDDDRGKPNIYGADHESIRVRKRIDACKCCHRSGPEPAVVERCTKCDIVTSSQPHPTHAHSEHQRMMHKLVRCPLYEKTYTIDIVCEDVVDASTTVPPSVALLNSQNPYVRYEYRTYDRISGIEEIADTVRGISSSEVTTRRRRIQEVSAQRRHSEHFRTIPPPRPCRQPQVGPQPGVPIAPVTPCNPGTQRVDYSIPNK
jgi:hypothetical protein